MHNHRRAHGPTVLAIRQARGLTMDTVATAANISPGYLSKIERGVRRAEEATTARLATALDVRPEILTGQRPALAVLRDLLGVTPDELAHDVGISPQRLGAIETGAAQPSPDLVAALARRLGVDPAALDTRPAAAA